MSERKPGALARVVPTGVAVSRRACRTSSTDVVGGVDETVNRSSDEAVADGVVVAVVVVVVVDEHVAAHVELVGVLDGEAVGQLDVIVTLVTSFVLVVDEGDCRSRRRRRYAPTAGA